MLIVARRSTEIRIDRSDGQIVFAGDHQHTNAERHQAERRDRLQRDRDVGLQEIAKAFGKQQAGKDARQLRDHEHHGDAALRSVANPVRELDEERPRLVLRHRLADMVGLTERHLPASSLAFSSNLRGRPAAVDRPQSSKL